MFSNLNILSTHEVKYFNRLKVERTYICTGIPTAKQLGMEDIKPYYHMEFDTRSKKNTFRLITGEHLNAGGSDQDIGCSMRAFVVPGCNNDYALMFTTIEHFVYIYVDGSKVKVKAYRRDDLPLINMIPGKHSHNEHYMIRGIRTMVKERENVLVHELYIPSGLKRLDQLLGFSGDMKGFEGAYAAYIKSLY